MEEIKTDVLVIGSGLAGIIAGLEASNAGSDVVITGKFAIGMGTNSSLAGGFFAAETSSFSKEAHLNETLTYGKGLNKKKLVKVMTEKGRIGIEKLLEYGVPLVEGKRGYEVKGEEGSSQLPGVIMMKALVDRIRKSPIKLFPGLNIFELIVEDNEIRGAFGFLRDGRNVIVYSKAIILATGGGGGIFFRNDNQKSILGDGYAIALKAGLPIFDLEFVQFYPFVLAEPRLSSIILVPPFPKEMRFFDAQGRDPFEDSEIKGDYHKGIIFYRDYLSIRLYEASKRCDVYCDLRDVPDWKWMRFPLNFLIKSKFPFRKRPFLISPAAHFFMGGVEIDESCRTEISGLYACGEIVWGIHGANRLGGNALTECLVFGEISGKQAAQYAKPKEFKLSPLMKKKSEKRIKEYLKKKKGAFERPKDILREIKDLAWKYAGPVREETGLKEGLDRLRYIEEKVERIYPEELKDLFLKKDLENISIILKAILKGSLIRKESRGSFFRKDFPKQDDENWLKNTSYKLENGEIIISHKSLCHSERSEESFNITTG